MRLSAIKQASSDVVEITAEDGPVFFVRLAYLSSIDISGLAPGSEFTDEQELELIEAGLAFAAERKAEEYLARCEQSRAGLERKLLQKEHSRSAVNRALDYLEERKLLSDLRFCEVWLRNHIITKPQGRIRLMSELCSRGIKTQDAKAALESFFEYTDESELCERAYAKAVKAGKTGDKLVKSLMDSGFTYKLIQNIKKEAGVGELDA